MNVFKWLKNKIFRLDKKLLEAVASNDVAQVKMLLDMGANATVVNKVTKMPLVHTAALQGNVEIIAELCRYGENINRMNKQGNTPLHLFAYANIDGKSMKPLVDLGADVNAVSNVNETPLHQAVLGGCTKAVRELFLLGANPEIQDNCHHTPLSLAVEHNFADIVKECCIAGADTTVGIYDVQTKSFCGLIEYAQKSGFKDVESCLSTQPGEIALNHMKELNKKHLKLKKISVEKMQKFSQNNPDFVRFLYILNQMAEAELNSIPQVQFRQKATLPSTELQRKKKEKKR